MKDLPLDRLGADGYLAERTVYYAALYPKLREVARQHGYALALHGSLVKDLDLIAVPWTEDAVDAATLARALTDRAGGMVQDNGMVVQKPHGRVVVVIHLVGNAGYIDLSIMPRTGGDR